MTIETVPALDHGAYDIPKRGEDYEVPEEESRYSSPRNDLCPEVPDILVTPALQSRRPLGINFHSQSMDTVSEDSDSETMDRLSIPWPTSAPALPPRQFGTFTGATAAKADYKEGHGEDNGFNGSTSPAIIAPYTHAPSFGSHNELVPKSGGGWLSRGWTWGLGFLSLLVLLAVVACVVAAALLASDALF